MVGGVKVRGGGGGGQSVFRVSDTVSCCCFLFHREHSVQLNVCCGLVFH